MATKEEIREKLAEKLSVKIAVYKQALDEIEKVANKDFMHTSWKEYVKQLKQILDIIKSAKGEE